MPFNKTLWEYGRKIEDEALPKLNKHFNTNFLISVMRRKR